MRNKQVEREKPGKVQRIGERGRLALGDSVILVINPMVILLNNEGHLDF